MVGWLVLEERRGWAAGLERTQVLGLRVLRAGVPCPRGVRERALLRRTGRAAQALVRAGVRRALAAPEFPHWDLLRARGLRPVEPEALCRALAAPLVLAALARRGVPPERATVVLSGARVDRPFFEAAQALCPRVRTLAVRAPVGGAELGRFLREEYGAAVLERPEGLRGDVAVQFSPGEAGGGTLLRLWGERPDLAGLALSPPAGLAPPPECAPLALLTLLWEEGRLRTGEIRISAAPWNELT